MWQEWFGHHFMNIHICFNFQERCPFWALLKSFRKQKQRLCAQPEEDRALCIHHLYTLSQGFWAICGPGCFPLLPDLNSPASGAVDNLACAWSYEVRRKPELPAGSEQFLARDPPTSSVVLLQEVHSCFPWHHFRDTNWVGVVSWCHWQAHLQSIPVLIEHPEGCVFLHVLQTDFFILNPHNMNDQKMTQTPSAGLCLLFVILKFLAGILLLDPTLKNALVPTVSS